MNALVNFIAAIRRDNEGQDLLEYALLVALIAVARGGFDHSGRRVGECVRSRRSRPPSSHAAPGGRARPGRPVPVAHVQQGKRDEQVARSTHGVAEGRGGPGPARGTRCWSLSSPWSPWAQSQRSASRSTLPCGKSLLPAASDALQTTAVIVTAVVAAAIDVRTGRIPNALTAAAALVGLTLAALGFTHTTLPTGSAGGRPRVCPDVTGTAVRGDRRGRRQADGRTRHTARAPADRRGVSRRRRRGWRPGCRARVAPWPARDNDVPHRAAGRRPGSSKGRHRPGRASNTIRLRSRARARGRVRNDVALGE